MFRVDGQWLLTPYRVAVHEPTATAVIADVHLGYSRARRDAGDAVPLVGVDAVLAPLRHVHEQFGFRQLIVAGDLFERDFVPALYAEFVAVLDTLGVAWVGLVPGNHDRAAARHADVVALLPEGAGVGDWRIAHGDTELGQGKWVIGHWHPSVRHGRRKTACYLVSAERLVLPAFSRDAAGADVSRERQWDGARRVAIVGDQLVEMPK